MPLPIKFDQGNNTAKDPSELGQGEMVQSTGGYYRPGSNMLHTIGGVTAFADTGTSVKVDGMALLQFDTGGTDKIVALSNNILYGATVTSTGDTGTFSALDSGLSAGTASLSAAHYNDRWYLGLGTENLVVKSDGTTRGMGMKPQSGAPVATVSAATTTVTRPVTVGGDQYTNQSNITDTSDTTYAHIVKSSSGTSTTTFAWSGTSNTDSARKLRIRWGLAGFQNIDNQGFAQNWDDVGSSYDSGFSVDITMSVSEDAGATYTQIYHQADINGAVMNQYLTADVTDALEVNGNLIVKIVFYYFAGTSSATLRLYDMVVTKGSSASNFSTTTGVYYALAEYDALEGLESKAVSSALVVVSTENSVSLALPAAAVNSNATHWHIYRTTDGGSVPSSLGLVGREPIASTTFIDNFTTAVSVQAKPFYPLLRTIAQQDVTATSPLYFDFNAPPPRLAVIRAFEGSLVGLSDDKKRALYFSAAGVPDAWPEINVISAFPLEEHDELVDVVSLGNQLLIAAKGVMMRLSSLPRVINSTRDPSHVEALKNAPGCVGRYALTAFGVHGEPRAAWISNYGIYVTNGDFNERISESMDWTQFDGMDKSGWVLHWDPNRLCLIFEYSSVSGGVNDRYQLLHMAPEHRKTGSEQPKWTGPHYGNYDAFASGQVGHTYRLYGAHSSNGIVYSLDRGGTDASAAYSGTIVPLIVKTGKIYAGENEWSALDAHLYHTDFGTGATCVLDWAVDNDSDAGSAFTNSQTVSLSGSKGTQLDLSQRCEHAQATITYTGSGRGALRDLNVETVMRGRRGGKRVS